MEWIISKNLKMFRYNDKLFIRFYFLSVLMLMISERCWSLSTSGKDLLLGLPIPNSPTTLKHNCYHTAADGLKIHIDCSSTEPPNKEHLTRNESRVNETDPSNPSKQNSTNVVNPGISSPNVTSINTAKALCNDTDSIKAKECHNQSPIKDHLPSSASSSEAASTNSSKENSTNLGTAGITTENSEIASMNDHFHKYKGGLDVDENLNTTNNQKNVVYSGKNSSESKLATNGNQEKGNKTGNSDISRLNKENSISKQTFSTEAAGIAAGICLTVASLAYISLMVWRKISYKHYGNREMLLNEDDLGDIHDEDMRHFEAACIQIET